MVCTTQLRSQKNAGSMESYSTGIVLGVHCCDIVLVTWTVFESLKCDLKTRSFLERRPRIIYVCPSMCHIWFWGTYFGDA
jgi:hypothetical protein